MKDPQKAVRKAFYETLNGQLGGVGVWDERSDDNSDLVVILSTQTGASDNTYSSFDSQCTMLIDIVGRTGNAVTKDSVDGIAALIVNLVCPTPSTNGLTAQSNIQFRYVDVQSDNYLNLFQSSTQSIIRRLIRFRIEIHET